MTNSIRVNGQEIALGEGDLSMNLLDYLRETLDLTGAKNGCGIGVCGACTVLIDGKAARACRQTVASVQGREIVTIEGLSAPDEPLHPVQQAFVDSGAIQCGFCTPGMVLTAVALLERTPSPTRPEIRRALNANLCRCTGYQQIVDAIELAAKNLPLAKK